MGFLINIFFFIPHKITHVVGGAMTEEKQHVSGVGSLSIFLHSFQ